MPNNPLVFNTSKNCYLSFKQARKAVESCAYGWEEHGVSIRKLNYAESRAALNERAKIKDLSTEILVPKEVPGLRFISPATPFEYPREAYEELGSPLAVRTCRWPREAGKFAAEQAA